MARLRDLTQPFNQVDPLPQFAIWGSGSGYDHSMQIIGSDLGKIATAVYQQTFEHWNNASYFSTANVASSNNSSYYVTYTPSNQAEGNALVAPTVSSANGSPINRYSPGMDNWHWYGTVIGLRGKRQKISIGFNNQTVFVAPRGGLASESFSMATTGFWNTSGQAGFESYGQISYNERTNTLVIIGGASSTTNYRAHVYINPRINLNDAYLRQGDLRLFMSQAYSGTGGASYFYNDFSWSTSAATSYTESYASMRVVLGDNNVIGLYRMTPSNQANFATVTLNSAGTTATVNNLGSLSATTSYGREQGSLYGSRSNITWDNEWAFCYSPYYYYGSGMNGVWFYTKNPSIYYTFADGSTSYGAAMLPFAENKWIYAYNADSNGGQLIGYAIMDPEGVRATGMNNDGTNTAVSNGSSLGGKVIRSAFNFDTGYTTTHYPCLVALTEWVRQI